MKQFGIYAVWFFVGVLVGRVVFGMPTADMAAPDMQSMADMSSMSGMHTHPMVEITPSLPAPVVTVEALLDTMDGYNLHITTENYVFTPENVNTAPVPGEGHAHIYVNGMKVARLYGNWFNLPSSVLRDGENLVEVTLNANDHSEWAIDGQHISGSVTVVQ